MRSLITGDGNSSMASAAAIWEIAIKYARRRGRADDMPIAGQQALALAESAGIDLLAITPGHAAMVDQLPAIHGDPFDRIMIAQARQEGMTLLTHDRLLAGYGAFVMVA